MGLRWALQHVLTSLALHDVVLEVGPLVAPPIGSDYGVRQQHLLSKHKTHPIKPPNYITALQCLV